MVAGHGDRFVFGELSDEDLEQAYAEAVCRRADLTGTRAHDERINGALALLAAITAYTPALPLLMALVDEDSDASAARYIAPAARRHCAGVIRLAHRALEVHAREVGYDPGAWRQKALTDTDAC